MRVSSVANDLRLPCAAKRDDRKRQREEEVPPETNGRIDEGNKNKDRTGRRVKACEENKDGQTYGIKDTFWKHGE